MIVLQSVVDLQLLNLIKGPGSNNRSAGPKYQKVIIGPHLIRENRRTNLPKINNRTGPIIRELRVLVLT